MKHNNKASRGSQDRVIPILATVAGLGLFAVVGVINVRHLTDPDMQMVVGSVAAASVVAAYVMQTAWSSDRKILAIFCLIGVIAGETFGFVTTVRRMLDAQDARASVIQTSGQPYYLADEAYKQAIALQTKECASGLTSKCTNAIVDADKKRAALAKIPVAQTSNSVQLATGLNPDRKSVV